MENLKMAAEDIAMDLFMRGLDNARNSEFKANLLNDLLVSDTKAPETLNAMYTRSATYILPRNVSRNGKGVVFGVHAFVEDAVTKVAEVEDGVAEAVLDVAPAHMVPRTTNLRRRSPSYVGAVAKRAID
jgi:hypothetical protein